MLAAPSAFGANGDIVMYATDATRVVGGWRRVADTTAAGGQKMSSPLKTMVVSTPLAAPPDFFEVSFNAPAATAYHVWLRLRAAENSRGNDSLFVQFSDAVAQNGTSLYRIGTTSALTVNLALDAWGRGLSGWGWRDGAYWLVQTAVVRFSGTGPHQIRIQPRDYGVQIDQIVLSPSTYMTAAPGAISNDRTILPRATVPSVTLPSAPASPSPSAGATDVPLTASLSWSATGATSYDVRFGTTNPPPSVATVTTASYSPASMLAAKTYYWQIIARNTAGATNGPVWSFTTTAPPTGVPAPWQTIDVGAVGLAGGASYSAGAFTVKGAGADIWGTTDAFRIVSQPVSGDTEIVARVTSLQDTNTFAKAGVMLRGSTAPDSAHTILDIRPNGSLEFMVRSANGGETVYLGGGTTTLPVYLRLRRIATNVTAAWSADAMTWTTIGSTAPALPAAALAALVVTSHDTTLLNTSTFDSVAVTVPVAPPSTPPGIKQVPAGGNLQAAIDSAVPGDTLQLAPGATYTGNFVLRAKAGTGVITITTGTTIPAGRVSPASAAPFATLTSPNAQPVIATESGAHDYALVGLHIKANPSAFSFGLVELGANDATQTTLDNIASHFVVDRCYVHGDPAIGAKRGIDLNAADATVKNSYVSDIKGVGLDTQAIAGFNGPGPYVIDNNYLEAAGENVLFGGADPYIANLVPSDITVSNNYLSRPLAWKAQSWQVKNVFELKNARRVSVRGNVFENNWTSAQSGYAILLTPRNQDGGCAWCTVADVDFQFNVVRHTAAGFNITGVDDVHPSVPARNIRIANNLIVDVNGAVWVGNGDAFKIGNGPVDGLVIDHNTIDQTGNILMAYGQSGSTTLTAATGFAFTNNIVRQGAYGVIGDNHGIGLDTLTAFFPGFQFVGNAIESGAGFNYPAGQLFPSSTDYTGSFAAYPTDYAVTAGSPLDRAGTDGVRIGVDVTKLPNGGK
jgi:hypothetical protein